MRVSLVIPGRNATRTLERCLSAVAPLVGPGELDEVVFVDDGSTDETPRVAARFPVRLVAGAGGGPGSARNLGWRAASGDVIWFIDADCVARADTLGFLIPHFDEPLVAGVGGSYGNVEEDSLLASMIHEEIIQRHLEAGARVDHLGSFNVAYRRRVLEEVGGFDETEFNGPGAPGAEDADLSYRVADRGYQLRLEPRAVVDHFHPTRLGPYLRAQMLHGFWGARLYARHRRRAGGNSYSGPLDHAQPALALLTLAALPTLAVPPLFWLAPALAVLLGATALPMSFRLVARTHRPRFVWFPKMAVLRAFARGFGLAWGVLSLLAPGIRRPAR